MEIMALNTHRHLSAIISPYRYTQRHSSEGYLLSSGKLVALMLETNKKQYSPKDCSLKIRIDSVIQILRNKGMLSRITDRRFQVYIDVHQITENRVQGRYDSLVTDYRKCISLLSLTRN